MAHKRPGVFKGQVRGVSHQGQENTLHLKAEYIDADFPSFETFPLHSHGGPYIRQVRFSTVALRASYSPSSWHKRHTMCRPGLEPALTAPRVPLTGFWPTEPGAQRGLVPLPTYEPPFREQSPGAVLCGYR